MILLPASASEHARLFKDVPKLYFSLRIHTTIIGKYLFAITDCDPQYHKIALNMKKNCTITGSLPKQFEMLKLYKFSNGAKEVLETWDNEDGTHRGTH